MWLTLNNKLNHFLFEYLYENSVVEKAEGWSYNVWNINHISLFAKERMWFMKKFNFRKNPMKEKRIIGFVTV